MGQVIRVRRRGKSNNIRLAQTPEGLIALDITAEAFGLANMADIPLEEDVLPEPIRPQLGGKEVLLVDPNPGRVCDAELLRRFPAHVHVCANFSAARGRLDSHPPDFLVANIRLHEYNALHLVLRAHPETRCIVYSMYDDVGLAKEVQAAGAFYERSLRLFPALLGYLSAELPPRDRRSVGRLDRRNVPCGGRRSSDL